ncbi:NAD(P)-dependent oxidoreductase [Algirhabdus cladophorae]|uniref:NAD(P)-dependent oxidoreductase n=1 Tax=Algirhabdus cladophorae TaxID=3377108 RepID=UPI003B846B62
MKTFPMFLQMQGRRVVIAGGGEQAAQKCRLILKTEADITVLAPELDPELKDLHRSGKINWVTGPITAQHFADTALVFVASGCPGLDASLHAVAKAARATVNVVDQPQLCDAITPSIVDRAPVVVAIGTEGTAPVLARQIKTRVEEMLEPRLGDLAALAGRLRDLAARRLSPRRRRDLWRWVFAGPVRQLHAGGQEQDAARLIKAAILEDTFEAKTAGALCVISAAESADKDLMTLRGVQRLQEADVIYYDRTLGSAILELARRDADRVAIGAQSGQGQWPADKTTQLLINAARKGQRIVHLTSSSTELISRYAQFASTAQVPFEHIPGVEIPAHGVTARTG